MNYKRAVLPLIIGVFLLVGTLVSLGFAPQAANNDNIKTITIANEYVLTSDHNFPAYSWLSNSSGWGFSDAELFYIIDETTVNTLTLTLQVSPDNSTWVNHTSDSAVASNVVADTTSYKAAGVDGRYFRIAATTANTNPVTVTIKAVLH